jgi:hypothetical protein
LDRQIYFENFFQRFIEYKHDCDDEFVKKMIDIRFLSILIKSIGAGLRGLRGLRGVKGLRGLRGLRGLKGLRRLRGLRG